MQSTNMHYKNKMNILSCVVKVAKYEKQKPVSCLSLLKLTEGSNDIFDTKTLNLQWVF